MTNYATEESLDTTNFTRENGFHSSGIARELGDLGPATPINEKGLAKILGCHPVTVRRAVRRGELPPPVKMFGKPSWTVGVITRHIEMRLERAAKEAEIIAKNS